MFVNAQFRLGGHARSDAALQLQPRRLRRTRTRASAATTSPSARSCRRTEQHLPRAGSGPARPAVLHQHAAERRLERFERQSAVETPTIRILDAQTIGGAQKAGGRHSRDVNFASDLDYVRGIHSVRIGTAIDFNSFRSDEADNYLGTYTFESLATFEAGRPRSYTRRIGEPNVSYRQRAGRALRAGRHPGPAQPVDHAGRSRRNAESHQTASSSDRESAPHGRRSRTARRRCGRAGGFSTTGCRRTPTSRRFASTGSSSAKSTSRIRRIPRPAGYRGRHAGRSLSARPGAGASEELARQRRRRSCVLAAVSRECDVSLRPRRGAAARANLNAPVNGVRPSPQFGNVIQVVGDGETRQHMWNFGGQTNPPQEQGRTARAGTGGGSISSATTRWRGTRTTPTAPFSVPATGDLDLEWGTGARSREAPVQRGISHAGVPGSGHSGQRQWPPRHVYGMQTGTMTTAI